MHAFGDWCELASLHDIDTLADIATVRAQLQALPAATAEQQALCDLLAKLSTVAEPCA